MRWAAASKEDHQPHQAYHGVTDCGGLADRTPQHHIDFDLPIAGIVHTSCPHH